MSVLTILVWMFAIIVFGKLVRRAIRALNQATT